MPGCRPIEREPAPRLIRIQRAGELQRADRAGHPAVDRDLPHAAITRARAQHARVRMKEEVADEAVGQCRREIRPCRAYIQALVHAQIGGNPDAIAIQVVDLDSVDRQVGQACCAIGPVAAAVVRAEDPTAARRAVGRPDALLFDGSTRMSLTVAAPGRRERGQRPPRGTGPGRAENPAVGDADVRRVASGWPARSPAPPPGRQAAIQAVPLLRET